MKMYCPECNNRTTVVESRVVDDVVVRKRKCKTCGGVFYTEEIEVLNHDTLTEFRKRYLRENKGR